MKQIREEPQRMIGSLTDRKLTRQVIFKQNTKHFLVLDFQM